MKITFVYPRFQKFLHNNPELDKSLVDYFIGDFTTPPSLGIPILAALTPPDIEIQLIDDNNGDPIDYDAPTDLVAINCFTPQATRAFEIGDGFRAAGKKVIMGGFFPSFMVDECLKHADSVNVGEGEPTWQRIVEDARSGSLEKVYKGGCRFDMAKMPIPRRDIFYDKETYDWDEDLVQITRGCMYTCAMCAIPAHMGQRMRYRPIDHVVEELKQLKYENVYLADDSLFFPHRRIAEYSKKLLKALIPLNKKYFVSSTVALNTDKEFLDLMAEAGVKNFYCTMNVDPISIKALQGDKAAQQQIIDLVCLMEDREIQFFGSCALGRDWDDEGIADSILELFRRAQIRTSEFFLFTPYPGSVHWDRMERQGRITDKNWYKYNGAHVVFEPMNMSQDKLYGQFIKVWNEFFRMQKTQHVANLEPSTYKDGVRVVGKPLERKGVRGQAVITGIGVMSPIGNDVETIKENLRQGKIGLAPITRFDASHFRTHIGGEIKDFDPAGNLSEKELEELDDPYLHYAISAARDALKQAGIKLDRAEKTRNIALVLGTCNGGLISAENEYRWKHGKADVPFDEHMNLQAQYYGFGKALAWALGINGEIWLVTTACSSTTGAAGLAHMLIRRRYYDTVLVGGADTLCVANMSGFDGLKATSTEQTAPFSMPEGLNIGEAACFWVVENMEKAILRHATPLGKIAGHATTSDAYHPTTPDPRGDGVYRTLRNALSDAGLKVEQLGCINAHGTGTEANDRAESKAIAKLIGQNQLPVVSTKSFFGHCMGTTGMLEATCNLLAMNSGFIPPTMNFSVPRPGCTLDYVPNESRKAKYDAFLSANYAFGGNNAAIVVTRWDYPLESKNIDTSERIVVTGAGAVSTLGLGIDETLNNLFNSNVRLGTIESLGLKGMGSSRAGLVEDFKAADIDRRLNLDGMNKISRMATAAARLALQHASLRVSPRNAEEVGIAMGVCNGPPETEHMDSVFEADTYAAHINSFSNITANSTAGWVSNSLCLKGVNTTLSPGPHAGLQSLAYAYHALQEGRVGCMLAGAADEVYAQTYSNYNLMNWLYQGAEENDYRLRFEHQRRKVLGEGAGFVTMETMESAQKRKATILAEVLGYGMACDAGPFNRQNLDPAAVSQACLSAIQRSELEPSHIDLVVWAPQGNAQDKKVLDGVHAMSGFGKDVPFVTSTFHSGYIESASILISLAAALASLSSRGKLWPQITGVSELDSRPIDKPVKHVLAVAGTDVGYNFAAVLKAGNHL